ncbi:MAG TPA: hypothetical protein VKF61_07005 [Candidatus Polarisedimenticolia bacterium]|nr:hypothetical protein [Candidatus Polarisedimenticolia bacterium]
MNSATDRGPRRAATGRAIAFSLAVALLAAPWSPLTAAPMTPSALRSILDKTDGTLAQAEKAVKGKDPGKVSLYLARVDELLVEFQEGAGLADLAKSFDSARAAAQASEWAGAASAVRRASALMAPLSDYVVLRQAAESSRAAVAAAEAHDLAAFTESLDRFDASILAPVMLTRVREARDAVAKARQAMVKNNMPDGQKRIGEVRRALSGLFHAGALSRVVFALSIGAEMLEAGSVISAKDQLQKALRDLKLAAETAPEDVRPVLEQTRATTSDIWKRASHATPDDVKRIGELARTVDAIRLKQPR